LHGYTVVTRAEGSWILPTPEVAKGEFVVHVIPLTYADAGEVATTLTWLAPPGVRVVPYFPTNSVLISGHPAAVEQMRDAIRAR
jgi:hypothetical protein